MTVVVSPTKTAIDPEHTLQEALISAHTSASCQSSKDGWSAVFDVSDRYGICTPENIELIRSLFSFENWASNRGCVALAIVIPEHMFEDTNSILSLSKAMHQNARVFFSHRDAVEWTFEMHQHARRQKLH